MSWIAVDFDGVLAVYAGWLKVGEPIRPMVERVIDWIHEGKEVRIFTARAAPGKDQAKQVEMIKDWCFQNLGRVLEVTCSKDGQCEAIYDDIAVRVEKNTGRIL